MRSREAQRIQELITKVIAHAEDSGYRKTVKALLAAKIAVESEDRDGCLEPAA